MGLLLAAGCSCCGSTVCVTACTYPAVGVTVNLISGGVTVATCVTGLSGCCTFDLSGVYTVQIVVSGTVEYQLSRTLSGTITIALGSSGFVCCAGYAIPEVLTLTDADGSLSFVYDPNYEYPLWTGGHSTTQTSCTVTTPNNVCTVAPSSQGPVRICYQMICTAANTPVFSVQRSWSWVYQQGTLTPIWYQDPTGFTPGSICITAPPAICGNPLTDSASGAGTPSSSSPFALSVSLTAAVSNATADPVGGSVAISA